MVDPLELPSRPEFADADHAPAQNKNWLNSVSVCRQTNHVTYFIRRLPTVHNLARCRLEEAIDDIDIFLGKQQ